MVEYRKTRIPLDGDVIRRIRHGLGLSRLDLVRAMLMQNPSIAEHAETIGNIERSVTDTTQVRIARALVDAINEEMRRDGTVLFIRGKNRKAIMLEDVMRLPK
jgi:hypothetical protein